MQVDLEEGLKHLVNDYPPSENINICQKRMGHDTRRERRAVKENTLGTNEKTVAMGNRWASRARKNLHFQRNAYVPPPAASKHSCLFEPGGGRSKVGFSLASSL